jgi:hypothetical protein
MMFFEWLENVVGMTVKNVDLLVQRPALPIEAEMICENPE